MLLLMMLLRLLLRLLKLEMLVIVEEDAVGSTDWRMMR